MMFLKCIFSTTYRDIEAQTGSREPSLSYWGLP